MLIKKVGLKMKLNQAIAQRIKKLLDERGINQYWLYKNGGIPRSTLSQILNIKSKNVSSNSVYQICATLGISLKEFYDDMLFDNLED